MFSCLTDARHDHDSGPVPTCISLPISSNSLFDRVLSMSRSKYLYNCWAPIAGNDAAEASLPVILTTRRVAVRARRLYICVGIVVGSQGNGVLYSESTRAPTTYTAIQCVIDLNSHLPGVKLIVRPRKSLVSTITWHKSKHQVVI